MKATHLMTMTMMKRTRRNTRRGKKTNTKMTMMTMTKKMRTRNTERSRRGRRRRMMKMMMTATNHLMTNMKERSTRRKKGANTRKETMTITITGRYLFSLSCSFKPSFSLSLKLGKILTYSPKL